VLKVLAVPVLIFAGWLGVLLASAVGLAALLAVGFHAMLREPYQPVARRCRLDLPDGWPALSVVHISDLHVQREDPRLWQVQIRALAGLRPDLVCVTGDVCEKADDVPLLVDVLRAAQPRFGTFIILGNHEHGASLPAALRRQVKRPWRRVLDPLLSTLVRARSSDGIEEGHAIGAGLAAAGFTVLHNEGQRVEDNGRTLWIAGCDSAWAGHADMAAAFDGRRPDEPCLALIHEPDLAFDAARAGADLILAGHTHGGQVRLPFVGAPITHRIDERIQVAQGFQRIGHALLHITAGLGHTVALRFRCPPEVVWLDCVPAEPAPVQQAALDDLLVAAR
jgi:predicted MPP superfamily phosphohydrolase